MEHRDPAFDIAVESHMKNLFRFALRLCRDHAMAEDLVQSTVLKAFEKSHLYQPGTNLSAWLYTILRNFYLSQSRKRKREVEDVDGFHSLNMSISEGQTWAVDLKIVRARMKRLRKSHRIAFEMVCILGHDYEHVAEVMGLPVGTVKSSVFRARYFIEFGSEIQEDQSEVAPAPPAENIDVDHIVRLYKAGKSVSEIAEEIPGVKKSKIMSLLASKNIKR